MRIVFAIALFDLRRRLRDRTAWVLGFVAPFALASIMGFAFGSGGNTAVIRVALADPDNTAASRAYIDQVLQSLSLGPGVSILRITDVTESARLYNQRRVSAAIRLPPGSSQAISTGRRPAVDVLASRTRPLGKSVAEAFVAGVALRDVSVPVLYTALDAAGVPRAEIRAAIAPAIVGLPPVRIAEDAESSAASPLSFIGPSMAIVFLFISVGQAANSVLAERTLGTLTRMQAAPVGLGKVIVGKTVSIVALMLTSVLALWGATTLAFDAYWGPPLAVVVLSMVTVLAIAALGVFVTVSARSPATAQVASAGLAFVLAMLGGNFFPPGSLPPLLERLALLTPNGWALEGFTTLSLDRGSLGDIVRPLVILGVMAAAIGALAVSQFRRSVRAA